MNTRDKEVLNMQFTLIPILAKAWNKSIRQGWLSPDYGTVSGI